MAEIIVGAALDLVWSHRQNRLHASERVDLRLLVGAQHQSPVPRVEIESHNIAHLLTSCGSLESLKVSLRCGRNPKARQMRLTAIRLIPARLAISRVLQCVAPLGRVASVRITTCSTWHR